MLRIIFAISCVLLHIPPVLIRYYPFHGLVSPKRRRLLFFVYSAILLVMGAAYYIFGVNNTFLTHKVILLFAALVLSVVNVFVIRGHWREHLFSASLASLHISATFYMCAFFTMRMGIAVVPMQIVAISASATFGIFAVLIKVYLNTASRVVTPFLGYESSHYWKRVWFLPTPLFLASFFSSPMDTYYDDWYSFISRVLVLLAAVLLCNSIAEDHKNMLYRLKITEQLGAQREYIEHLSEHVAEARKSRHDFKHHLAAIRRYIDTDDKSGLAEYWEDLNKHVSTETEVPCTGNTAFDGVLYRYSMLARQNGINLEITGVLENIVIQDADFTVLVGNALDNAFFGCMTVENDRRITVQMKVDHDEQMILIRNSYDGIVSENDGRLLSRKRDDKPGIGLDSMRSICDKYGAIIDVRYDNDTFAVLLLVKVIRE